MKKIFIGLFGLVISVSSAFAGHHGHDAGKLSFISVILALQPESLLVSGTSVRLHMRLLAKVPC